MWKTHIFDSFKIRKKKTKPTDTVELVLAQSRLY